jgi:hypothetical protein
MAERCLDPQRHALARATALLSFGIIGGILLGWAQSANWFNRVWWRLFRERGQPTVWTSFFRDPGRGTWGRIELVDGRVFVGHVDQYSIDAGQAAREILLTEVQLEERGGWIPLPGEVLVDAAKIASVILTNTGEELSLVTDAFYEASGKPSVKPAKAATP